MTRRIPRSAEVVGAALLAWPTSALAADPATPSSLGMAAFRTAASLAIVLGLIALLAFLFRRFRESASHRPSSGRIASIARLDLGGRREIRLVEIAGRRLVVGVAGDRIELLTELEGDEEVPDEMAPDPPRRPAALEVLRKLATS